MKSQQFAIISKLYTKIHNFNKIPYKCLVNTLLKLKNNFCPTVSWIFTQKSVKMQQKRIYDKTPYVWSKQITPAKKKYTAAGCDGWDI